MRETRSSAYGNYDKCVIARINSHIKPVEWYNKSVCSRTRIPTGVCVRACAEQRRVGQRDLTSNAQIISTHTRTQSQPLMRVVTSSISSLSPPFFQASAETSPRGWGGDEGCRGEGRLPDPGTVVGFIEEDRWWSLSSEELTDIIGLTRIIIGI